MKFKLPLGAYFSCIAWALLSPGAAQAHSIPAQPLAAYAGSYEGFRALHGPLDEFGMPFRDFNIEPGYSATLTMDRDIPVIRFSADLVGANCNSQIGEFQRVESSFGKLYVFYAFNPGSCGAQVIGKNLIAVFSLVKGQPQLRVEVVKSVHVYQVPVPRGPSRTNYDRTLYVGQFQRTGN